MVKRAPLTPEQLHRDFALYAESCLVVEDKLTQRLVPFRLKPIQHRIARQMLQRYLRGAPIRMIVLKARREGVSTVVQAFMFWIAATRPERRGLTVAHDDYTTRYLFGMAERFYERLPEPLQPMRRTAQRGTALELANPSKNPRELRDNPGLQSALLTVSRKNAGAGLGATMLHLSEVALWHPADEAKKTLDTILSTVPRAGETLVVLESTARGIGNEFHRRWRLAEQGISEYEPIFIAWYEEPTNRARPPEGFRRTEHEDYLARLYDLENAQLWWRRLTIENECGGDVDVFRQEYPATPDEAFLSTGRPYFNPLAVRRHYEEAQQTEPWDRGRLLERDRTAHFIPSERGELRVWEPPIVGEDYLIFADASEGSEGDFQCAYVMPRSRMEFVACWHGRIDPHEFGDVLYRLGHLYNEALIGVEVSGGWGNVPVSRLRSRRYKHIYRRVRENRRTRTRTQELGWDTTIRTRPLMLEALNEALRQDELVANDPELLTECTTFVYNDSGKPAAEAGSFDDRVMAAAGAIYLWTSEPRRHQGPRVHRVRRVRSTVTGY